MSNGFNPLTEKLRQLAPLSEPDGRRLDDLVTGTRLFAPGEMVRGSEDDTDHVPVVIEGMLCRARQLSAGREQITNLMLPGDFGDLMCTPRQQPQAIVRSAALSRAALVHRDELFNLLQGGDGLALALHRAMLVDLAIAREWTVSLGRRDAAERMAHLMLEIHGRLRMVGLADERRFELPLTQRLLADILGLSVVHMNRTVQRLRGDGMIMIRKAVIEVLDAAALTRLAGFNCGYFSVTAE